VSIPAAAKPTPIPKFGISTRLVNPGTGVPDTQGLQQLERLRSYVSGMGRVIPCSASGTNIITLTPSGHASEDGESPLLEGLIFGDAFAFWAAETSTGSVTMTVVPKTGTLSTLKAYVTNGSAQAGAGNVVQNLFYVAYYVPILDGAAGGFVLK
jgi:hypothetical protein